MKKVMKTVFSGLLIVSALALGVIALGPTAPTAQAASCNDLTISGGASCANTSSNPQSIFGNGGIFTTIVNVALFIIGALSVMMLIYGGIRYVISAGDAKKVESAKNTILYAVVGVIIAVLAYAIVNFVLTTLLK
jgi:hypothetical protein